MASPATLTNRALDSLGSDFTPIGDLQEGGRLATAALRIYQPTLKQLLRCANWNFARKRAPLMLLQDATGQTTANQIASGLTPWVGTGTLGMQPWIYEYQWPIDGVRARWVPVSYLSAGSSATGNIAIPSTPQTGGNITAPPWASAPARFLVAQDNVPPMVGAASSWSQYPDLADIQGQGRAQQTVILTNQPQASLVYTALVAEPDEWDPLFQQAFVATLASQLAMQALPDKRFAMEVRKQQIVFAKEALAAARVADGDEQTSTTVDHVPDWMRARTSGGWRNSWGAGSDFGVLGYGWGSMSFADGSVY